MIRPFSRLHCWAFVQCFVVQAATLNRPVERARSSVLEIVLGMQLEGENCMTGC